MRVSAISMAALASSVVASPMAGGADATVYETAIEYATSISTIVVTAGAQPTPAAEAAPQGYGRWGRPHGSKHSHPPVNNAPSYSPPETSAAPVAPSSAPAYSAPPPPSPASSAPAYSAPPPPPASSSAPAYTPKPEPSSTKPAPTSSEQPSAAPSAPASGSGDCSGATNQEVCEATLALTNKYRANHPGVGSLTWSKATEDSVQQYVNTCVFGDHYDETADGKYGTNAAQGYSDLSKAVSDWYQQVGDYTFWDDNSPPCFDDGYTGPDVGHFTALVWKSSTKLGCATKDCPGGQLTLCGYADDSPNMLGSFTQNVIKPSKDPKTIQSEVNASEGKTAAASY